MKLKTWTCDLGTITYKPMTISERLRFGGLASRLKGVSDNEEAQLEALAEFVDTIEKNEWIQGVDITHEGEEVKSWEDLNHCSFGFEILMKFAEVFTPKSLSSEQKKS